MCLFYLVVYMYTHTHTLQKIRLKVTYSIIQN